MIYHITLATDWQPALTTGSYTPPAFATEGFIHCCQFEQLVAVGQRYFRGQMGLVVLCIDPAQVTAPLQYEAGAGRDELFPHLYGPLNLEAVHRVVPFLPRTDGTFAVPRDLLT
jgi:uncharacterized protein (DUF952 family)